MVSGRYLSVFRFLQFIPYGLIGFCGAAVFKDVRNHPKVSKAPYSPNVASGQGLAAVVGCIGFTWNFFTYLPMAIYGTDRGCLLLSAALDCILASGLLVAFVLQSTYMPRPLGQCHNADVWMPVGSNHSIFTILATKNSTHHPNITEIRSQCNTFAVIWVCEIPMFILSFLATWIALRAVGIAPNIGAIVFQHALAPTRFAKGYRVKYQRHRRAIASKSTAKPVPGRPVRWKPSFTKEKQGSINPITVELTAVSTTDSGTTTLDQILSYPVISSIAESSHFQDMQSLMLTSKSIYNAFLGSLGPRSTALMRKTCKDGSQLECWCCQSKICYSCKLGLYVHTSIADHAPRCHIYCSKCYYTTDCYFKRRYFRKESRFCSQRCRSPYTNTLAMPQKDLCRVCHSLPYDSILRKRTEREKALMAHRAELTLNCAGCKGKLSENGPRWWNCNVCKKECASDIHPAWAGDGYVPDESL